MLAGDIVNVINLVVVELNQDIENSMQKEIIALFVEQESLLILIEFIE